MKTTADWINEIEALYEGQKSGKVKPVQAVEMNNTIGKLISLTKVQLEYQRMKQSLGAKAVTIPMLEAPTRK